MIEKIKALCVKHREILVYLIVGGLTTVVSWAAKFLWNFLFYAGTSSPTVLQNTILSVVENAAGIAFAYPTNRRWVFHSEAVTARDKMKELVSFFACRLFTGLVDWACMYVFVDLLHFNDLVIKILANVVVIILNYIGSKFFVFSKRKS